MDFLVTKAFNTCFYSFGITPLFYIDDNGIGGSFWFKEHRED